MDVPIKTMSRSQLSVREMLQCFYYGNVVVGPGVKKLVLSDPKQDGKDKRLVIVSVSQLTNESVVSTESLIEIISKSDYDQISPNLACQIVLEDYIRSDEWLYFPKPINDRILCFLPGKMFEAIDCRNEAIWPGYYKLLLFKP